MGRIGSDQTNPREEGKADLLVQCAVMSSLLSRTVVDLSSTSIHAVDSFYLI